VCPDAEKVGSAPEKRGRRTDFTAAEHHKNPNGTVKRDVAGQKMAFFNGLLGAEYVAPTGLGIYLAWSSTKISLLTELKNLQRAQASLQAFLERPANGHGFADAFHLRGEREWWPCASTSKAKRAPKAFGVGDDAINARLET
jgi:hypothetical protein